ncbi:MAG: hypothetical protein AAF411_21060 [Myxococcota bacterium]
MRCVLPALILASLLASTAHAQAGLEEAGRALRTLRIEDMSAALEGLEGPEADYLRGMEAFHRGEYDRAVRRLEAAVAVAARPAWQSMLELAVSTRDVVAGYEEATSDDGRYSVRYAPGPDSALVPYTLDVLRRADAVLQRELGHVVPGPIRVEIYPSTATLAAVSTLTVENIETSGTIALCKWDRLMVTSPRALLRGYSWMDTIAHEFVHLVLSRATADEAPVWVQEGIAKFFERHWRESPAADAASTAHLSPSSKTLLARALASNSLLPFERLHPSIALLPSQEQAALAYAQVSSFIADYYRTHGREDMQRAIALMARGADAREALADAAGVRFPVLEHRWRASLGNMDTSDAEFLELAFGPEGSSLPEGARRHMRLADMMWSRGRPGAAAAEYERALRQAPRHPLVAAQLARATVAHAEAGGEGASRAESAIATLRPFVARQPDYAPLRSALAGAYAVAGQSAAAADEARAAIRLNPFDPAPHCVLAELEIEEAEAEGQRCRRLGGGGARREHGAAHGGGVPRNLGDRSQ